MEILGFDQHHQKPVGCWKVTDGQKDLSCSCGWLLKQKGDMEKESHLVASDPSADAGAGVTVFACPWHPRSCPPKAELSTLEEGRAQRVMCGHVSIGLHYLYKM
jgi:hypothetical protein